MKKPIISVVFLALVIALATLFPIFPVGAQITQPPSVSGTWTPTIGGSGGQSLQTYTTQVGNYVKVGPSVTVGYTIILSAKGTITSIAQLQSLPFTITATANYLPTGPVFFANTTSNFTNILVLGIQNTTTASLFGIGAAGTSLAALAQADLSNTTEIAGTFSYLTSQ